MILILVGGLILRFFLDLKKDDTDLHGTTVSEKFKFVV